MTQASTILFRIFVFLLLLVRVSSMFHWRRGLHGWDMADALPMLYFGQYNIFILFAFLYTP